MVTTTSHEPFFDGSKSERGGFFAARVDCGDLKFEWSRPESGVRYRA
jgi:hypothetical protein